MLIFLLYANVNSVSSTAKTALRLFFDSTKVTIIVLFVSI